MQYFSIGLKHWRYWLIILLQASFIFPSFSQNTSFLNITNYYNENILYNSSSQSHTALKPVAYLDSSYTIPTGTWFERKFLREHFIEVKQPTYRLYADPILDEVIGKSSRAVKTPVLNTRGFEVSGSIKDRFYFETAFYENQAKFPGYIDSFIRSRLVVPGQAGFKNVGRREGFDFSTSEARIIYLPAKNLTLDLGYGKNFIGDGYRSVLLSDWAPNYPYFKATYNFGRFQYSAMWSHYISDINKYFNNNLGYFRKWGQTFFLDWKATNRLCVGLFESVMWPDQDSNRHKDMSPWIASPIMFLHGNKSPSGVTNNVVIGTNISYRLLSRTYLYGQFAADKLGSGWENRYALQAGIRSESAFNIPDLNILAETNMARPYTYATSSLNTNYSHNNQPLAHALGANFIEGLAVAEYKYKRLQLRFEGFIAKYGGDSSAAVNYGHDIFKLLPTHTVTESKINQGLKTNIFFADFKIAYIINPANNLRVEAGFTYRNEKNNIFSFHDRIAYLGIRMSYRKIFYDF